MRERVRGFGLLEMLLALVISFFLMSMSIEVVFALKSSVREQSAQQQWQSKALKTIVLLHKTIPEAMHFLCFHFQTSRIVSDVPARISNLKKSSVLQVRPSILYFITVHHAQNLLENMRALRRISVRNKVGYQKKGLVFITDCRHAEINQIASIRKRRGQPVYQINLAKPLQRLYKVSAKIAVLASYRFFLKPLSYNRKQEGLFVETLNKRDHELISGVTALHFDDYPGKGIYTTFTFPFEQQTQRQLWQTFIAFKHPV